MAHIALAGYTSIKNGLPSEYTDVLVECKTSALFSRTLRTLHTKKRNIKLLTAIQKNILDQCVSFLDKESSVADWNTVTENGGVALLSKFTSTPIVSIDVPSSSPKKSVTVAPKKSVHSNASKQKIRYTATVDKERFAKLANIIRGLSKPKEVTTVV